MSTRHHPHTSYWIVSTLAGLFIFLISYTGAWSQEKGLQGEDTRQRGVAKGLQIIVREGRLSVDVQEADLGEVLVQIGRQAHIRMVLGPSSGKRVSARLEGVELEEGIRRLLRLVSLSHIFLHARGPADKVILSEVRVLGEGQETSPRQATATDRGSSVEPTSPQRIPKIVEPVQEPTPEPGQAEPTEVTRRVREVFKLGKEMGRPPADAPASSPPAPVP
jgi:hypothetical protein